MSDSPLTVLAGVSGTLVGDRMYLRRSDFTNEGIPVDNPSDIEELPADTPALGETVLAMLSRSQHGLPNMDRAAWDAYPN